MPHAVSDLRAARLARSAKPFLARGGFKRERCADCRLVPSHCMCALRPSLTTRAGVCLLMADIEPLKPSNTGWLVADVVPDTFAFGWKRTETDPALLALLRDPQWHPYVVFPGRYAAPERVVRTVQPPDSLRDEAPKKRPLFILLDGTWSEARKMFRRSPYLDRLPVLSLEPDQTSQYKLRNSGRNDHFCTSEVAALCMKLAGELAAEQTLEAYLAVFTHHYLHAKNQQPIELDGAAHQRLREVSRRMNGRTASQPAVAPASRNGTEQRTDPGRHCHGQCAPEGHAQRALGHRCAADERRHGPQQGEQECGADDSPWQQ
jgi:DTW domain-containing protein YfiP